ncbi:MAG: response regulator [Gammaproteobacteria bacterium]|nr:response regulator [Gammaproteobacteria bacterium]
MAKKVLFVDDEPNVLQSIRRSLRKVFDVDTAEGGQEALEMIEANGSYAVIVSDMRMPGMNGVEFLSEAKRCAPDTVRMMLTGNADQQTAVDAVNHGDIFRFLNKPCAADELTSALNGGIRQHELITAEKELLEQTLRGSIDALANVLALSNPEVFGSTSRSKQRVHHIAKHMNLEQNWIYESAAMLCKIGCIAISEDLVRRKVGGHKLDAGEYAEFAEHATIGAKLVSTIPRMEDVARAIQYQEKCYDGSGFPKDGVSGADIPLGGRMLKVVLDYDAIEASGAQMTEAIERLNSTPEKYDPQVLVAFEESMLADQGLVLSTVSIMQLDDSMIVAEDLKTEEGVLLIAKGQETTLSVRRHLQKYRDKGLIGSDVVVRHPAAV